jgi:hypothetical protein
LHKIEPKKYSRSDVRHHSNKNPLKSIGAKKNVWEEKGQPLLAIFRNPFQQKTEQEHEDQEQRREV